MGLGFHLVLHCPPSTYTRADNTDVQTVINTLQSTFPAVISFQPPDNSVSLVFCFFHFIGEKKKKVKAQKEEATCPRSLEHIEDRIRFLLILFLVSFPLSHTCKYFFFPYKIVYFKNAGILERYEVRNVSLVPP